MLLRRMDGGEGCSMPPPGCAPRASWRWVLGAACIVFADSGEGLPAEPTERRGRVLAGEEYIVSYVLADEEASAARAVARFAASSCERDESRAVRVRDVT